MSRSGYNYDREASWDYIRWRGAVTAAIRGKRGQAFLKELLEALDALPEKRLIDDELHVDGAYCALGAVGAKRGLDMSEIDPYDYQHVAKVFGISEALAREIVAINDDDCQRLTPERRYEFVRGWVIDQLARQSTETGK